MNRIFKYRMAFVSYFFFVLYFFLPNPGSWITGHTLAYGADGNSNTLLPTVHPKRTLAASSTAAMFTAATYTVFEDEELVTTTATTAAARTSRGKEYDDDDDDDDVNIDFVFDAIIILSLFVCITIIVLFGCLVLCLLDGVGWMVLCSNKNSNLWVVLAFPP